MTAWRLVAAAVLAGFARLPADTFAPGPPSGRHITPAEGLSLPFRSQPVQGFSSVAPDPDHRGWWLALADNGYGTKDNSDDFLLRIYRIRPHWRSHRIEVNAAFIQLADPDRHAGFALVNDVSRERMLTGADFDPESLVVDRVGSFWIGEEFGPCILHFAKDGRLLEAPFEKEGLKSPDDPIRTSIADATVRRSRGFEGLAPRPDGRHLLAMLEAGLVADAADTTRILEFDTGDRRFTGRDWRYRFDAADHSATEISPAFPPAGCRECESFFVIERDNEHGPAARFKKIFRVDLAAPGDFVARTLAVDLLAIDNPKRIAGFPPVFTFPFITPEAIWQLDAGTLIVVNDNNYPEAGGRAPGVRDDTEMIRVRIR